MTTFCSAMSIAESSREPGYGEDLASHQLPHSNSSNSFARSHGGSTSSASSSHFHQRTQL